MCVQRVVVSGRIVWDHFPAHVARAISKASLDVAWEAAGTNGDTGERPANGWHVEHDREFVENISHV